MSRYLGFWVLYSNSIGLQCDRLQNYTQIFKIQLMFNSRDVILFYNKIKLLKKCYIYYYLQGTLKNLMLN